MTGIAKARDGTQLPASPDRAAGTDRVQQLHGRLREAVSAALPPLGLTGIILAVWFVLTGRGTVPAYVLPSPLAVLNVMGTQWPVLVKHATATTREALMGFVIGNVLAIGAALLFSMWPVLRTCFYPLALVSRGVPVIAITPLLVLIFGRGLPPIVAVVTIAVSFPTFLNTMRGLMSADRAHLEMLHTLSASPWQRLRLVEIPAAMPYLLAALKVSASIAFISALVAEWIGASAGLGYLVVISGQYFKLPLMWAAITAAGLLTLGLLGCVALLEHALGRWTAAPVEI